MSLLITHSKRAAASTLSTRMIQQGFLKQCRTLLIRYQTTNDKKLVQSVWNLLISPISSLRSQGAPLTVYLQDFVTHIFSLPRLSEFTDSQTLAQLTPDILQILGSDSVVFMQDNEAELYAFANLLQLLPTDQTASRTNLVYYALCAIHPLETFDSLAPKTDYKTPRAHFQAFTGRRASNKRG